jgi:trimethylamine---corrinoid protein Co-methyltransferase
MLVSLLPDDQLGRIEEAALRILERTGVQIPHPEALKLFAEAGAQVDDAQRVRIPRELARRSIASCGKQWTIYGRDRDRTAAFGVGQRNYNTTPGNALWIDEETGERRYPVLADAALGARFVDALQNVNIAGPMATPHELPAAYACVAVTAEALKNTTKPIHIWWHDRPSARFVMEALAAVSGGEEQARSHPLTFLSFEPISPLRFPFHGIDLQFETRRFNLPVCIGPMVQAGMSGPVTLAGTVALETAELLAAICITQLICPGAPVRWGGIAHAFDMRTTQMVFGGPEQILISLAMLQMGKRFGLPVNVNVGMTDSKCVDAQAGLECAATLLPLAMAGADGFGDFGISGVDQGASLDMAVLQDELAGYVERVMQGIDFDSDALAEELIERVGPGGTFIDLPETAARFRREFWFPRLLDRQYYEAWFSEGRSTLGDLCAARRRELLQSHTPSPLDDTTSRELDRIVASAARHLH